MNKHGRDGGGAARYRLPFALCNQYGIAIQKGWKPRDAWEALKKSGYITDIATEYSKLYEDKARTETFPYEDGGTIKKPIHYTYSIDDVSQMVESSDNPEETFGELIKQGKVNLRVSAQKQRAHIPLTKEYERRISMGETPSILTADAEELVRRYAGKGELVMFNGKWKKTEVISHSSIVGVYINKRYGLRYETKSARIHYATNGVHIVPDKEEKK